MEQRIQPRAAGRDAAEVQRLHGLRQRRQPRAVDDAHPRDMPLQKAARDELAQRLLLKPRHGAGRVHRSIARRQLLRQHHEAQAQTGRERPRKRVHVDDLPPAVHGAQRGRARAGEAEFAIVIVLQNIAARLPRPAQKRRPLAGLHLLARRELMRRGDVGRARAAPVQFAHVNRPAGKRGRRNPRAADHQNAPNARIAGVFHREKALAPDQRDQRGNQHLRARAQNDGLRRRVDAAHAVQIARDFPSERRFALRVAGEQQGRALLAEHLAHQPRPRGVGKMRGVRRACSEVPADRRLFPVGQADALRLFQRVNAASGAALAKPLADEPRIGRLDRRGADAQVRRQLPLGGHPLPRTNPAALHFAFQRGIELLAEGDFARRFQCARKHVHSTSQCAHSRT